jgi:molybdenum cofactor cytidylyltransferase
VAQHGRAFVAAGAQPDGKLVGVDADDVAALAVLADVTLVEADGARGRWLKAPSAHEPAIPPAASLVVPVVGLQAIGVPLAPDHVHRPERVAELLGLAIGEPIPEEALARLLLHAQGGLRGVPRDARVIALCNQADDLERRGAGRRVAAAILGARGPVSRVVVGAAQGAKGDWERWEPSAAVVLAAGAGRRYGGLKQAEVWGGRPFLSRVTSAALESLATDVLVVLGCRAAELAPLLAELGAPSLHQVVNERWRSGLASSVRAGLSALAADVMGVAFCHADQPLLTADELDALLVRRAATGAGIVAPRYRGELRAPVLFARPFFPALAALSGDTGGRALLERHPKAVATIEIEDPSPYEDIDTRTDYLQLGREGNDG